MRLLLSPKIKGILNMKSQVKPLLLFGICIIDEYLQKRKEKGLEPELIKKKPEEKKYNDLQRECKRFKQSHKDCTQILEESIIKQLEQLEQLKQLNIGKLFGFGQIIYLFDNVEDLKRDNIDFSKIGNLLFNTFGFNDWDNFRICKNEKEFYEKEEFPEGHYWKDLQQREGYIQSLLNGNAAMPPREKEKQQKHFFEISHKDYEYYWNIYKRYLTENEFDGYQKIYSFFKKDYYIFQRMQDEKKQKKVLSKKLSLINKCSDHCSQKSCKNCYVAGYCDDSAKASQKQHLSSSL